MALLNPLTSSQPSVLQSSSSPNTDSGEDIDLETAPSFGSQLDAAKSQGLEQEQSSTNLAQSETDQTVVVDTTDGKILQPVVTDPVAQPANIAALASSTDLGILDVLGTDVVSAQMATADAAQTLSSDAAAPALALSQTGDVATALTNTTINVLTENDAAAVVAQAQPTTQPVDTARVTLQAMASSGTDTDVDQATSLNDLATGTLSAATDTPLAESAVAVADAKADESQTDVQADAGQQTVLANGLIASPFIAGAGVQLQQPGQVADTTVAGTDSQVASVTQGAAQINAGMTVPTDEAQTPAAVTSFAANMDALSETLVQNTSSPPQAVAVSSDAVDSVGTETKLAGSAPASPSVPTSVDQADAPVAVAQSVVARVDVSVASELPANVRILKADSAQSAVNAPVDSVRRPEGPVGLQAVLADSEPSVVVQRAKPEMSAIDSLKTAAQGANANVSVIQSHPSMISHDGFNTGLARSAVSLDSSFTQTTFVKLEPHEVSLNSGPVSTEVLRVLKEGGGRVVMEVTPPDQGTVQLDLRLDNKGNAHLVVQGASDSTRARMEQGSQQLFDQFQSMGLNLTMDMRQQSEARDQPSFAMADRSTSQPGSESGVSNEALTQFRQSRAPVNESAVSIYA